MTIPGGTGGIKTPTTPGSASVGPTMFQVMVKTVDTTVSPPIAVCADSAQREIPVRMDLQRGKGSIPQPGERWVIDKTMGVWTFACYIGGDPTGAGVLGLGAVSGLSDALSGHDDALAAQDDRLNNLFQQGTVTAVGAGGTSVDVTHPDGSVTPGAQVIGSYAPHTGDAVWTGTVDQAGAKIALGTSANATGSAQMAGWTAQYDPAGQSIFATGAGGSGIRSHGALLEVIPSSTPTVPWWSLGPDGPGNPALLAPTNGTHGGAGVVAASGILYAVSADNTLNHAPFYAKNVQVDSTALVGDDGNGNPAFVMPSRNAMLVGGQDGIHVANGNNSNWAPLLTGPLTVTGQTNLNGGINGTFGAAFGGATVFANAGLTVTGQTNVQGIIGTFGCSFHGADATFDNVKLPGHNISTDAAGSMNSLDYYGGTFHGAVVSEKRAKREHGRIDNGLEIIQKLNPVIYSWLDPERDHREGELPGRLRAGLYVDDLAEVAPESVFHLKQRSGLLLDEELDREGGRDVNRPVATDERNFEDRAVIAYVVDAIQKLLGRIEALEAVIDARGPSKD